LHLGGAGGNCNAIFWVRGPDNPTIDRLWWTESICQVFTIFVFNGVEDIQLEIKHKVLANSRVQATAFNEKLLFLAFRLTPQNHEMISWSQLGLV
jgi:hypothetical protein